MITSTIVGLLSYKVDAKYTFFSYLSFFVNKFFIHKIQNAMHFEAVLSVCIIVFFVSYFSVLTPYYSEETVYSKNDIEFENEDGVSIIYYLQKIFPG